jgi:hypothetical protein
LAFATRRTFGLSVYHGTKLRDTYLHWLNVFTYFGPFGLILIWDPPGARHAFPRQRHMHVMHVMVISCHEGRGGGLFISTRVFFPVWCHPWMDDEIDGWMEKASWKTTMTSFTICNLHIYDHEYMYKLWM